MIPMITVPTVACVPTVCFMAGVVLAFMPMAFMVVPVVIAVVTTVFVVSVVISRLMRSCWGLTHTVSPPCWWFWGEGRMPR